MFEKAKLSDGKDSFKSAEAKKVREKFQGKNHGQNVIQLERLNKKSPEAYKQVMALDHKSQKILRKVQDRNNGVKFTKQLEARARKDLRPVEKNLTQKSSGSRQEEINKSVAKKKSGYEAKVFKAREKMINKVTEKHGIKLDHGKTKNRIR